MPSRLSRYSMVAMLASLGCSTAPTRTVTGQLTTGTYAVDNPVVIAQTTTMARYVSHVQPDGSFHITVPVGARFQLLLANSTRSGQFINISHINFTTATGQQHFVTLASGGAIALGGVRPIGTQAPSPAGTGLSTMSETAESGGDDDKAENDDDGKADRADVCDGAKVTESECDHGVDDDGDHHASSGSATSGGLKTSDDHESDDDKMEMDKDEPHACPPADMGQSSSTPPTTGSSGGCTVNADCVATKICLANICSSNTVL